MKLSIIIVNYNVKHFLEQCLHSVYKALAGMESEIFVVDNHSLDGSCHLVKEKFPEVILIENQENVGYSRANNQAIRLAKGEYILLLNPDTVVEEDTFDKTIRFMDEHPDAGGLGVKMIDGKGTFLPESKRGLPTPWVAFYKIFGLSKLFPSNTKLGRYHLSFLDKDLIHSVDILCGAFMLMRKTTLEKTGLLDETFFMYGEDIDLSYRILKAGYKNYYFPDTTIIHYKGESTRKGSINYVKMFYHAMLIFSKKHFSGGNFKIYSYFIHLAIYFRAFLAIAKRVISRIYLPVADFIMIYIGYRIFVPLWEKLMFEPDYYPEIFLKVIVPAYILIWLTGIQVSGGYRRPVSILRILRGILWGTLTILIAYSLINEQYRFSRALILIGTGWSLLLLPATRIFLNKLKIKGFELDIERQKRIAIAGREEETVRVINLLHLTPVNPVIVGTISLSSDGYSREDTLGPIGQIREIIQVNRIDEIIFCAEDLSSAEIIRTMLDLSKMDVTYKIAPPESFSIIGSNSIHTAGDLYLVDVNAITKRTNLRQKRWLDIVVLMILVMSLPIILWFYRRKFQLMNNLGRVLTGSISWVGYIPDEDQKANLPGLKPGVLNQGIMFQTPPPANQIRQLNILYAKDYRIWNDLELIVKNWKKLDNKPNG